MQFELAMGIGVGHRFVGPRNAGCWDAGISSEDDWDVLVGLTLRVLLAFEMPVVGMPTFRTGMAGCFILAESTLGRWKYKASGANGVGFRLALSGWDGGYVFLRSCMALIDATVMGTRHSLVG
ncbi:unnamed protein product [Cuscuta campestris]|uniref:Uncharacterized protein n=1 Tax=Cuscuta campestris TaxID=132261 RepID=A0A484MWQ4_9ASTE|nr:unnamed protein product [Cuscuta campestris]